MEAGTSALFYAYQARSALPRIVPVGRAHVEPRGVKLALWIRRIAVLFWLPFALFSQAKTDPSFLERVDLVILVKRIELGDYTSVARHLRRPLPPCART